MVTTGSSFEGVFVVLGVGMFLWCFWEGLLDVRLFASYLGSEFGGVVRGASGGRIFFIPEPVVF